MTHALTMDGYTERTRRLIYFGSFVLLGLAVGGVFVVAGDVAGAIVLDAFDVYPVPEWAMPLGWAVGTLYLVYGTMRLYERYA